MLASVPTSASPARQLFAQITAQLEARYGQNGREMEPGHWAFEVMTGGQRSQVIHLLFRELATEGQDVSRVVVTSPVGPVPPRPDYETLLRWNAELDVGAISITDLRTSEGVVPFYTVRATHLVGTADFEEVWEMAEKVARVADALEKEIYATDTF